LPYCLPCVAGTYQSLSGQANCLDCPINTYSPSTNQESCKTCDIGTSSVEASSGCLLCDLGKFHNSITKSCQVCPAGYVQTDKGQVACKGCNIGQQYISTTQPCQDCDLGMYGSEIGTCSTCTAGRFQKDKGQIECNTCANGKISNLYATACEKPSWKIVTDCSSTQYLNNTSEDKLLWSCDPCPLGGYCGGDITWNQVLPLFGWWKIPTSERGTIKHSFAKCLYAPACLGKPNNDLKNQYFENGMFLRSQC